MKTEVRVMPPDSRCTSQWGRGTIIGVQTVNNVDGVSRHILGVLWVFESSRDESSGDYQNDEHKTEARRRSQKERHSPV